MWTYFGHSHFIIFYSFVISHGKAISLAPLTYFLQKCLFLEMDVWYQWGSFTHKETKCFFSLHVVILKSLIIHPFCDFLFHLTKIFWELKQIKKGDDDDEWYSLYIGRIQVLFYWIEIYCGYIRTKSCKLKFWT